MKFLCTTYGLEGCADTVAGATDPEAADNYARRTNDYWVRLVSYQMSQKMSPVFQAKAFINT